MAPSGHQFATRPNTDVVGDLWDVKYAFMLFTQDPSILGSSIGSICSVAVFNFSGVSVTKLISATSRTTIDACRTLLVWIVSLALAWEMYVRACRHPSPLSEASRRDD